MKTDGTIVGDATNSPSPFRVMSVDHRIGPMEMFNDIPTVNGTSFKHNETSTVSQFCNDEENA
ncbi:MAG TPA: hypothetical protein V6C76_07765 [Drouetiella sp.]